MFNQIIFICTIRYSFNVYHPVPFNAQNILHFEYRYIHTTYPHNDELSSKSQIDEKRREIETEEREKNNFPETIQFVRESSRHSRIRGTNSRQQKRYTENQRTLDEAFRQRHVFIYIPKTITTLAASPSPSMSYPYIISCLSCIAHIVLCGGQP